MGWGRLPSLLTWAYTKAHSQQMHSGNLPQASPQAKEPPLPSTLSPAQPRLSPCTANTQGTVRLRSGALFSSPRPPSSWERAQPQSTGDTSRPERGRRVGNLSLPPGAQPEATFLGSSPGSPLPLTPWPLPDIQNNSNVPVVSNHGRS